MYCKCKPALLLVFCLLAVACTPKNPTLDAAAPTFTVANTTPALPAVDDDDDDDDEYLDSLDDTEINTSGKLTLIKPSKGSVVTSPYGMRRMSRKKAKLHAGVDIIGDRGENIIASAPGTIVYSGRKGAYGLMIDLDVGNGVVLRYAHMEKLKAKVGQKVKRGQVIGYMGRTGRATAYHLHFEVRVDNKPKNPMQFIPPEHRWATIKTSKRTTQAVKMNKTTSKTAKKKTSRR